MIVGSFELGGSFKRNNGMSLTFRFLFSVAFSWARAVLAILNVIHRLQNILFWAQFSFFNFCIVFAALITASVQRAVTLRWFGFQYLQVIYMNVICLPLDEFLVFEFCDIAAVALLNAT